MQTQFTPDKAYNKLPYTHRRSPAVPHPAFISSNLSASKENSTTSSIHAHLDSSASRQLMNSKLAEVRKKYENHLKSYDDPTAASPLRDTFRSNYLNTGLSNHSFALQKSTTNSTAEFRNQKTENITGSSQIPASDKQLRRPAYVQSQLSLAEQVENIRVSLQREKQSAVLSSYAKRDNYSPVPSSLESNSSAYQRTAKPILSYGLNCSSFDSKNEPIDRINGKIRDILKTFKETSVKSSLATKQPEESQATSNTVTRATLNLLADKQTSQSFIIPQNKPTEKYQNASLANALDERRHSLFARNASQLDSSKGGRSTSIIVDKSRQSDFKTGDYILNSGKDLDEEIRKIQEKIKKSEEQKRKLNISFKQIEDLTFKQKSRIDISGVSQVSIPTSRFEATDILPSSVKLTETQNVSASTKKQEAGASVSHRLEESPSFKQLNPPKIPIMSGSSNTKSITNISKFDVPSSYSRKPAQIPKPKQTQEFDFILKPVPCDLQQTLSSPDTSRLETKKLLQSLTNQIALDEKLRNSKVMFQALQSSSKYSDLLSELVKHGISLTEEQLKQEFKVTLEEHNPFQSVRECQESMETIAENYVAAHKYWIENIKSKFNRSGLKAQDFSERKIDLQKNGRLKVEDFVRFINIETGTFNRNRDVVLLFRRMTMQETMTFQEFLRAVAI